MRDGASKYKACSGLALSESAGDPWLLRGLDSRLLRKEQALRTMANYKGMETDPAIVIALQFFLFSISWAW